jgi:hypothetical protein
MEDVIIITVMAIKRMLIEVIAIVHKGC